MFLSFLAFRAIANRRTPPHKSPRKTKQHALRETDIMISCDASDEPRTRSVAKHLTESLNDHDLPSRARVSNRTA